jgi:hypothetical protein
VVESHGIDRLAAAQAAAVVAVAVIGAAPRSSRPVPRPATLPPRRASSPPAHSGKCSRRNNTPGAKKLRNPPVSPKNRQTEEVAASRINRRVLPGSVTHGSDRRFSGAGLSRGRHACAIQSRRAAPARSRSGRAAESTASRRGLGPGAQEPRAPRCATSAFDAGEARYRGVHFSHPALTPYRSPDS